MGNFGLTSMNFEKSMKSLSLTSSANLLKSAWKEILSPSSH